ncbi:MAG: AAA family ATPase [Tabrizicola sp.]
MFEIANLTLAATLGLLCLVLGTGLAWAVAAVRADRMPAAARYADIRERLALAQDALHRAEEAKRDLDRQIQDRDRLAAEVAQLQARVDELRLELENLAASRAEIDMVKQQAAEAAREKAEIEEQLGHLRSEAERLRADLDPQRIEELARRKTEAEDELARIRSELERLRPELDTVLRQLADAKAAEARVAALALQQDELHAASQRLREELTTLQQKRDALAGEVESAQAALEAARTGQHAADRRREAAEAECRDLETRAAALEETLDRLRSNPLSAPGGTGAAPVDPVEALGDLVALPACLASPATLRGAPRTESEALHGVSRHLKDSGLSFARRTIRAFHTALKINDAAQLTVLAGVSGTGKSLLPRRYAEAMGIHFLQIAVEPRWDSPQDLLGFYNYVEGKYRATELARLMANLDPWQSLDLPEGTPDRRDRMALVLLDEMNLARVEYYFSEFLSRLEARPAWRPGLTQADCKDALIPVDIRGLSSPPRLFPAHNILFVGTMNDDESTQSLSDKVLDRGNILQFPAPTEFPAPSPQPAPAPAAEAQRLAEWRGWIRDAKALSAASAAPLRETVAELSQIMQGFGRPFGHRLNQAISAYAVNYPFEGNAGPDLRIPLADQVEFRILPKLRGIEIDSHRERFEVLTHLIRNRLDDASLADRLARTVDDQERGSNLFFWRGLTRQDQE